MKITIDFDGNLAGYTFTEGREKLLWENMTRQEQIHILNALAQGYELFYGRFLKED